MRVRDVESKNTSGISSGKSGVVKGVSDTNFVDQLKRVEEKQVKQELDSLLDDIDAHGKKLLDHQSVEDLHAYKSKVKEFLSEAVKKIYKLKEEMSFDRRGRHRIYSQVEKVDKELEELTMMFMDQQQDKLAIASKIDEIRGMLVDIYM